MTKIEGATWSSTEEDGYNFRTWEIELVQSNDNISRPSLCIAQEVYTCAYEWLDADAVCQEVETSQLSLTVNWVKGYCQLDSEYVQTGNYLTSGGRMILQWGEDPPFFIKSFDILSAFGTYPVLTKTAYRLLSDAAVIQRTQAYVDYLIETYNPDVYTINGDVISHNEGYCPIVSRAPMTATYTWSICGGDMCFACSTNHEEGNYKYRLSMDCNYPDISFMDAKAESFEWNGVYYAALNTNEEFLALPKTYFVQRWDAYIEWSVREIFSDWIDGYDILIKPETPAAEESSNCAGA
jgi:hypothetical protein